MVWGSSDIVDDFPAPSAVTCLAMAPLLLYTITVTVRLPVFLTVIFGLSQKTYQGLLFVLTVQTAEVLEKDLLPAADAIIAKDEASITHTSTTASILLRFFFMFTPLIFFDINADTAMPPNTRRQSSSIIIL